MITKISWMTIVGTTRRITKASMTEVEVAFEKAGKPEVLTPELKKIAAENLLALAGFTGNAIHDSLLKKCSGPIDLNILGIDLITA